MSGQDSTPTWPDGATWVFQGTVAEDATGGTHVCTLTVTPGAGNEFEIDYGLIISGNTATAQTQTVQITDGTNIVTQMISMTDTAANIARAFPPLVNAVTNTSSRVFLKSPIRVSGTMQLQLSVSTAAISVTQTFAVVCRIKGAVPTATLADTVGTPTLTTNTSKVF